ncbi:ATP-binding protein [uncultured Friedmanniella sp.]|uniref:ATP-binding protein n=1 Tax=uncultured Friedmanniella sp. TaxID=335381 RepID=UPI0035CB7869
MTPPEAEAPIVTALRKLSVFNAHQGGAYREHYAELATTLGPDIKTKLAQFLERWASNGQPGIVLLTGNAGTGKTAAAEAYCRAVGAALPGTDALLEAAPGRWVLKDLSGVPTAVERAEAMAEAAAQSRGGQVLLCANEGILRDAFSDLGDTASTAVLDEALLTGAAVSGGQFIVNVNRQRPTGDKLWAALLDYVTREELWAGCDGCPFDDGGCAMRSNAAQLRRNDVRSQLRTLFRLGAGDSVPTLREVLAILSWAVVGDASCRETKDGFRDLGQAACTASDSYYSRLLGGGLEPDSAEKSPLLVGIKGSGLGLVSDLEVDSWLRDSGGAPEAVQEIAGTPPPGQPSGRGLDGSRSPLDRVNTAQQQMTFHALGEMISTSEDVAKVEDGLTALVRGSDAAPAAQSLWRRRVYFEAAAALGGPAAADRRLLRFRRASSLAVLAADVATGRDTVLALTELVRGLNFLVTGFPSPDEGMVVPDPACLFSRDPGAFRPAAPSLVHSLVPAGRLSLRVPDRGLVEEVLDIDHVDVVLEVDHSPELALRISPRMYEAICEAADFGGPVGQGVAEMNDLRSFYGRLASTGADEAMRVADPTSSPPALLKITLPHFAGR